MRILILGAFKDELKIITQKFPDSQEIFIAKRRCLITKKDNMEIVFCLSGMGTIAAACTTTALCEVYEPDLIIFCGVAGGLGENQRIGDLVLGKNIIDVDLQASQKLLKGTPYESCLIDPHTLEPAKSEYKIQSEIFALISSLQVDRLKISTIATSNIFPVPKELLDEIIKSGCSVIEMESSGVFKAAEYYHIPVMTVRAISNLINDNGDDLGTDFDVLEICSERIALFLKELFCNIQLLKSHVNENQQRKISKLVAQHGLIKHPEGGWYRQTFKSTDLIIPAEECLDRYNKETRSAGTSIIYLLDQGNFSAWHTVQSDETWSFHSGDPILLRVIDPDYGDLREILLSQDILQFTVKAGHVFSAETLGRFSLTGCTVTPGFDFKDFKLISRFEFIEKYPRHSILARLIRDNPIVNINDTEVAKLNLKFFNINLSMNESPYQDLKQDSTSQLNT